MRVKIRQQSSRASKASSFKATIPTFSFSTILYLFFCLSSSYVSLASAWSPTWWSTVAQLSLRHAPATETMLLSAKPMCSKYPGLSPGQARICELFWDHMHVVSDGTRAAIEECQHQFKNRRWNCSTPYGTGVFGPMHQLGTREAGFTYAIVAAGVTYEISRACKLGRLNSCGCNQEARPENLNREWLWGGCGDNVHYGYQFSQNFIDIREREKDFPKGTGEHGRSLMNRWNNEVGRKGIRRKARVACKCHGVSGSCNLKTCWKQSPTMREIGDLLVERYDDAVRVKVSRRGNLKLIKHAKKRRAAQMDLVYLDESPDYCKSDVGTGRVGTEGRVCNKNSSASDSCDALCCGRGHHSFVHNETEQCHCKFVWCCQVQCKQCTKTVTIYSCRS